MGEKTPMGAPKKEAFDPEQLFADYLANQNKREAELRAANRKDLEELANAFGVKLPGMRERDTLSAETAAEISRRSPLGRSPQRGL